MSAATTKIVKWAAAGCVVAIIAGIGYFACFKGHKSHHKAIKAAPKVAKETTACGQDVYPTALAYVVKATVKGKGAAAPKPATIKCEIENSSLCLAKTQLIENKSVIIDRGGQTVQFSVNLLDNSAGFFCPAFKVPAGVVVENIEVTESPAANGEPELTIVEGTILERSAIPDPEKSDYPDCRFTCHFKGNSIVKGKPCPQELSLILEGFADRKLLGTKDLKPGDRVICIAMPFNKLPQERQTTQQADDLNLFALESYYAIDVRKIDEFSDLPGAPSSGIAFTDASDKPYVSVFERHVNPPIKEEFRKAQQEAIAQELQKIEAMLAPYTPERIEELQKQFAIAWEAEKAKDPPGYNRVVRNGKEYVWRNIENSFWALPTDYRLPNLIKKDVQDYQWPDFKEEPIAPYNLEALIALRDFLEANGCQLLISPVPDFQEIAARVINPEFRAVLDFQTAYMAKQLLKNGIETFYPSKTLVDNFHRYPFAFFFPNDHHPSDTTQDVMTDLVSEKLSRYYFHKTLDSRLFFFKTIETKLSKRLIYHFPNNCDIGGNAPNKQYQCRQVWYNNNVFIANDKESPLLIIGNSFMGTPAISIGPESFPTILSTKIAIAAQIYRKDGMGPMTATIQQLFSSPNALLSRKTIVILFVGTRHLCNPYFFYNICKMDVYSKMMSNKTKIHTFAIKANIAEGKARMIYSGIVSPNLIKIIANEPMTLVNTPIANIDMHKSMAIVIPTCLRFNHTAKYIVNGQEVIIPRCYDIYRHLNAFCELPAGTDWLKIEIVGKPNTILSIRNIQVYQ